MTTQRDQLLREWLAEVTATGSGTIETPTHEALELLNALRDGIRSAEDVANFEGGQWERVRSVLQALSQSRAAKGISTGATVFRAVPEKAVVLQPAASFFERIEQGR